FITSGFHRTPGDDQHEHARVRNTPELDVIGYHDAVDNCFHHPGLSRFGIVQYDRALDVVDPSWEVHLRPAHRGLHIHRHGDGTGRIRLDAAVTEYRFYGE